MVYERICNGLDTFKYCFSNLRCFLQNFWAGFIHFSNKVSVNHERIIGEGAESHSRQWGGQVLDDVAAIDLNSQITDCIVTERQLDCLLISTREM